MDFNRAAENRRLICLKRHLQTHKETVTTQRNSNMPIITADQWWKRHYRKKVLNGEISYFYSDPEQINSKKAVVFLHGNPTSSYLWRGVIPRVEGVARCLAPDLIGMGRSSKLPGSMYTFADHYKYLCGWFDSLDLPNKITIVCHDWGSGLGLHWAYEHQDHIEGLVYMEGLLLVPPSLDIFPAQAQEAFKRLRSKAGEEMVIKNNIFVEKILPSSILRELHPVEMAAYREPYLVPGESRRPTLTWPREIPFLDSGPQYMIEIVGAYADWLEKSDDIPKLFIDSEPGLFSSGLRLITDGWKNQKTVKVKGLHFLQEDSPVETGEAIKEFVLSLV